VGWYQRVAGLDAGREPLEARSNGADRRKIIGLRDGIVGIGALAKDRGHMNTAQAAEAAKVMR